MQVASLIFTLHVARTGFPLGSNIVYLVEIDSMTPLKAGMLSGPDEPHDTGLDLGNSEHVESGIRYLHR